jgi:hypothetical protein
MKHNSINNKESIVRAMDEKVESSPGMSKTMERFIDEKCNLLSKRGISKGGTVHLARWMKGQFDKQACASEPIESDDDDEEDEEEDIQLHEWSSDDLKRRSIKMNMKSNQKIEEMTSEDEQNEKSASKSTTSDSHKSQVSLEIPLLSINLNIQSNETKSSLEKASGIILG